MFSREGDQSLGPQLIARLDRWAGKPLCAVLSLVERSRRPFATRAEAKSPPGAPRRMLFVKLIEMGSTVLATPAFAEAERLVGRDNLFILVFGPNRVIADVLPFFRPENVIAVDDRGLVRFALSLLRALMRIRRERIDTAIDMEGLSSASAIITYLTGASRRVGFYNFTAQGPYRGRLFNRELNYTFQHHVSKTFLALVRAAAVEGVAQQPFLKEAVDDTALAVPRFEPEPEELEQVRALLATRAGSQPHRIVILNPNCSDLLPLRRWPTERFIEVGKQLISEMSDVTLVISGAPSEAEEAARIAVAIGSERVLSLAGHTTMRQLLALYCLSDLLITNDSGPVHFAALTPMRVLALFGPETPKLYGPLGRRARALTADLACSPCVSILNHRISPCSDNRCMQAISTEQVLKAAKELLAS
jgi:ADP-heptose:LPS heptosyltransferase